MNYRHQLKNVPTQPYLLNGVRRCVFLLHLNWQSITSQDVSITDKDLDGIYSHTEISIPMMIGGVATPFLFGMNYGGDFDEYGENTLDMTLRFEGDGCIDVNDVVELKFKSQRLLDIPEDQVAMMLKEAYEGILGAITKLNNNLMFLLEDGPDIEYHTAPNSPEYFRDFLDADWVSSYEGAKICISEVHEKPTEAYMGVSIPLDARVFEMKFTLFAQVDENTYTLSLLRDEDSQEWSQNIMPTVTHGDAQACIEFVTQMFQKIQAR